MTPGGISRRLISERIALVEIRALPLADGREFLADSRNVAAAESLLRRAIEALLDVGRHILAKGFGAPVSEYKAIADELGARGVLDAETAGLLRVLAGYRRLVHFYADVTPQELHEICRDRLGDLEAVADGQRRWVVTREE